MSFPLSIKVPVDGGVAVARGLLLGVLVTMLVSTSLSVGVEIAAYLAFAGAPELRRRLVDILRHPAMIGFLPLAAVIVIATFYGPASWTEAIVSLFGWRRMLLLPLALAVFDDEGAKRLVLRVAVLTCVAGALASFVTAWGSISLTEKLGPGIVFNNYATQGLALSVATIICVAALLRPEAFAGDRLLEHRPAMVASIAVMLFNIVFVLWGRTGSFAVVVMIVATVVLLARGTWRMKALAGAAVLLCLAAVLASSAHVRGRVAQGLHEIETVDQSPEGTRFGQRIVGWRNTVRLIRDHPILGVGTGGFQDGYRAYVAGVSGWQGNETGDPHNQFLKIQGEQGLLGLAAFLFFILRMLTCSAPPPWRQLAAAVLLGWCATSLANSDFSTHVEGRFVFFWLGAMLAGRTTGTLADDATV
jgi:O-antigen ligase